MPINGTLKKNCIYVSLNARSQPGEYHWGIILTDSNNDAVLHHANNRAGPWLYEKRNAKPDQSMTLIVLVLVDGVKSPTNVVDVVQSIPADGKPSPRSGDAFTCRIWVKDVLVALHQCGEIAMSTDIDALEAVVVKQGRQYTSRTESGRGATIVDDAF